MTRGSDLETAIACAERMTSGDVASRELGIDVSIPAVGEAIASMQVGDAMLNGFGICHGGYVFTLADTAFAFACNAYNDVSVAAGGSIDFLRPVVLGDRLTATAVEDQRIGRHGHYTVTVTRDDGDVVALFRGRSAARSEPLLK